MQINLIYDSVSQSAPAAFKAGMQNAADILDAACHANITCNILVGYGEFNNNEYTGIHTGALGGTMNGSYVSYSTVRAALAAHSDSADMTSAVDALPAASSLQGSSSFYIGSAEEKALGLINANGAALDGAVGMGDQISSSLLVGVALHELTHAMGRLAGEGIDLFRYSGSGTHYFGGQIPAAASYLSFDGGMTKVADFGQGSDPGDFLNAGVQGDSDPFNEYYSSSTTQALTNADLRFLDVMGFGTGATTTTLSFDGMSRVADFNGDGKIDVLRISGSDGYVSTSTGTGFDTAHKWGTGLTSSDQVADLNGDGKADLVQFWHGFNYVSLSNGSGFNAWQHWGQGGGTTADHLVDVTGDGKTDLVQIYNGNVYAEISSGANLSNWQQWTTGATASDQLVDLNHDGKADLIQFWHGFNYVALSNGNGFNPWHLWGQGGGTTSDQLLDVTGEGRKDLVQIWHGNVYVAASTGTDFGNWQQWTSGATSADKLADVNGDGKADLVQVWNGHVYVGLSTGSSFGNWSEWGSGGLAGESYADMNGDGKADILQFDNGNAYVALSTGSGFGAFGLWGNSTVSRANVAPLDPALIVPGDPSTAPPVQYMVGALENNSDDEIVKIGNPSDAAPAMHADAATADPAATGAALLTHFMAANSADTHLPIETNSLISAHAASEHDLAVVHV